MPQAAAAALSRRRSSHDDDNDDDDHEDDDDKNYNQQHHHQQHQYQQQHQYHQHQHPANLNVNRQKQQQLSALKLKCIVLGAAGAGKTSILRRYFAGNFPNARKPTLGADFYSGRVPNPLFRTKQEVDNDDAAKAKVVAASDGADDEEEDYDDDEEKKMVDGNKSNHRNSKLATATTTIQRQSDQQLQQQLVPIHAIIMQTPFISIQMWDTAGRERFVEKNVHRSKYTAALGDAFFRNVDAALLVYDVTSSTSFTQLLRWYADLTERVNRLTSETKTTATTNLHYHHHAAAAAFPDQQLPFPVVIVGNKMDVLKQDVAKPHRRMTAPRRDVMGLRGQFRGKDSRYEYRALCPQQLGTYHNNINGNNLNTASASHHNVSSHFEFSTYLATGESWTSDGSYLHSLLNSEDGSHPDREMVLLWCMRNGLKHVEVSALDGTGIDQAMKEMVAEALEARKAQALLGSVEPVESRPAFSPPLPAKVEWKPSAVMLRNKKLDLHARYAPKEGTCCRSIFPLFHQWCK